jgi:hypothetical protein
MIYTGNRHCFFHGFIPLLPSGQPGAAEISRAFFDLLAETEVEAIFTPS